VAKWQWRVSAFLDSIDRSALDRLAERNLKKIALSGRSLGKHQIHDLLLDGPYDLFKSVLIETLSPTFGNSHRTVTEFVDESAEEVAVTFAASPNEEYQGLIRKAPAASPFGQRDPFDSGVTESSQNLSFDVGTAQVWLAVDGRGGKRRNTSRGCIGTLRSRRLRGSYFLQPDTAKFRKSERNESTARK
jgi:hypothetical protein